MTEPSENGALIAELRKVLPGVIHEIGKVDGEMVNAIELPVGRTLQSLRPLLNEWRSKPERRQGTVVARDVESFTRLVNRFKSDSTAIFCDVSYKAADEGGGVEDADLLAIIDYDEEGPEGEARFGTHRVHYGFPVSEEWCAWRAAEAQAVTGARFGRFLEDRILDIADPAQAGKHASHIALQLGVNYADAGKLMMVSKDLLIKSELVVSDVQNLVTGEARILYQEHHLTTDAMGTPLQVPAAFLISIPVFRGEKSYQLPVRLQYERRGGAILWHYKLYRSDVTFEHALSGALKQVEEQVTDVPVYRGHP